MGIHRQYCSLKAVQNLLVNGETQGPSDQPTLTRGLTLGMTSRFFSIFFSEQYWN
jgi:hypothetical protein